MKKFLRDPLLHFLVLGAGLFLLYGLVSTPGIKDAPDTIVVTEGHIQHLAASFSKVWQRPPTETEIKGLVDDWIQEEIATREAMALGLDRDDTVIRRRLRQKLEFVSEDIAAQSEPTDEDLNAYLQAHPESFRVEPRYTFSQVYLDPEKHGARLESDTAQLLAQLNQADASADNSKLGDSLLLDHTYHAVPANEIARQFGESFKVALEKLAPGPWQGPLESGYGVHLVRLDERTEGHLPALADVRAAVHREWSNARRQEANKAFYQELLNRYTVTIEGLEPKKEQTQAPDARP